jgi:LytS/YehU family sensor histidine kinase
VLRLPLTHRFGRPLALGVGIALGATAGESVLMLVQLPGAAGDGMALSARVLRWSSVAIAVAALLKLRARSVRTAGVLHSAELATLEGQTQLTNLRLQALRAQIEPHFLFNTLATIRRLDAVDPALGMRVLDHLHTFIRLSMAAQPGDRSWPLADELALVLAYLGVVGVRMDGALGVEVDVDPRCMRCEMPPLALATLVENAVKHGITPLAQGGAIRITGAFEGDSLVLTVADTGVGFRTSGGTGIGLANTRARLLSTYGPRAWLALRANEPQGVVAQLHLPLSTRAG